MAKLPYLTRLLIAVRDIAIVRIGVCIDCSSAATYPPPKLYLCLPSEDPRRRKTRSGCSGVELISAFHVLQKFRDKIKTEDVELDDSNLESIELEMEVDNDAFTKLDGLLEWMDSKIKSKKKVCS